MKRLHLSHREQLLSALVIVVVVFGAYALLRFLPANKAIVELQSSAASTRKRLLKARIPDQPVEDIDKLSKTLDQLKQEIALTDEMTKELTQRLAPIDSQALKLQISQLARNSDVYIRSNEKMQTSIPAIATVKKSRKKPGKVHTEALTDLILPETASWVARMSPGTLFYRPMQRIELEGSYLAIRQFIHGLSNLSYQVTVLKLRIEKGANESPAGYPQSLLSELVLAL